MRPLAIRQAFIPFGDPDQNEVDEPQWEQQQLYQCGYYQPMGQYRFERAIQGRDNARCPYSPERRSFCWCAKTPYSTTSSPDIPYDSGDNIHWYLDDQLGVFLPHERGEKEKSTAKCTFPLYGSDKNSPQKDVRSEKSTFPSALQISICAFSKQPFGQCSISAFH